MIQKRIVVGGGTSLDGYVIRLSNGNEYFISSSEALSGYNASENTHWALEFSVSTTTFQFSQEDTTDVTIPSINNINVDGGNPFGTSSGPDLFDGGLESQQTYYRLPLIRNGQIVNNGGVYRENIYCLENRLIAELVKIG